MLGTTVYDIEVTQGSIIVEFSLSSQDESTLRAIVNDFVDLSPNSINFIFNGHNLTADSLTLKSFVSPNAVEAVDLPTILGASLGSVGGLLIVVILVAVGMACLCKIKTHNKIKRVQVTPICDGNYYDTPSAEAYYKNSTLSLSQGSVAFQSYLGDDQKGIEMDMYKYPKMYDHTAYER